MKLFIKGSIDSACSALIENQPALEDLTYKAGDSELVILIPPYTEETQNELSDCEYARLITNHANPAGVIESDWFNIDEENNVMTFETPDDAYSAQLAVEVRIDMYGE